MKSHWKIAFAIALFISPVSAENGVAENARGYTYLALGDSVSFGFDPLKLPPFAPLPPPPPSAFIGYPEIVADIPPRKIDINASCPGETSGSFLVVGAPDNGCNGSGPQGQPPFKLSVGLHTPYAGSQMQFARTQLQLNPNIKLVTISIGGNDILLLLARCSVPGSDFEACVAASLPGVLAQYGRNLALILYELRQRANYSGDLVLVTYYSPNVDPVVTRATISLNQTMKSVGREFGVKVAEVFVAFELASARFGFDPCEAGLLIALPAPGGPNGRCDIHPSPKGRDLIAAAVLLARR